MFDSMSILEFGQRFKDTDGVEWVTIQSHRQGWVSAVKAKGSIPAKIYLVQNPELLPKDEEASKPEERKG